MRYIASGCTEKFLVYSSCVYAFVFSTRYPEPDAVRITKLDTGMHHHESWKLIYFGIKMSTVKVTTHKKTVPAWAFAFL